MTHQKFLGIAVVLVTLACVLAMVAVALAAAGALPVR